MSSPTPKRSKPCGNPRCAVSSGLDEGLTFGSGTLDFNGYWSKPCGPCARDHERRHPEDGECWPYVDSDIAAIEAAAARMQRDDRWPFGNWSTDDEEGEDGEVHP